MTSASNPPADIRTVAKRARVSTATVSRVMNGITTVHPRLVARVVKAAEELHYTPNTQARALVSGKSGMIGLIVSEITNPFFPELIQQFEDETVKRGYEMLIGSTNYSPSRMTQCIRRMVERKVEGVAVMTFGMDEDLLLELSRRGVPVVSVGTAHEPQLTAAIEVDHHQGIQEAVQHLASLGHRRIAYIRGSVDLLVGRQRQQAYVSSMAKIGINAAEKHIFQGDHTMDGGLAAAEQIFASGPIPTAIRHWRTPCHLSPRPAYTGRYLRRRL
jgi:LacI family transcriptional regulator